MAYATADELIARHAVLKNWGYGPADVTSNLIYFAETELNGRLAPYYSTPFSDTPPTVKDLTIDLSYLKALYSRNLEEWVIRNDAFELRMTRITTGVEPIFTGSGAVYAAGGMPWSSTQQYHPVHSFLDAEDPLTRVDCDLITEEVNERS